MSRAPRSRTPCVAGCPPVERATGDVLQPEGARAVPEPVVPLGERRRELPGAPAVRAEIPRFSDQFDLRQHRVGPERDEEGVVGVVGVVAAPGERRREIEAEPVDVVVLHPVSQRVQHHPAHDGVAQVQRVAAPGHVDVLAAAVQAVVTRVVQAAPRDRGAVQSTLLAGVVVDDVEHDLEPGPVQIADHRAELVPDGLRVLRGGVRGVRREEPQRVVTPVVREAAPHERGLTGERVHREQLQGRHAEPAQVLGDGGVREPCVGAAQVLGDLWVPPGEPGHVRLVEDGARPRNPGRGVVGPVEAVVDDDAERDVAGAVAGVAQRGVATSGRALGVARVPVDDRVVVEPAVDGPRVRVEEQLGAVVPVTGTGIPRAVGAVAVPCTGPDAVDVPPPHAVGVRAQRDLPVCAGRLDQHEVHRRRVAGEDAELGARRRQVDPGRGRVVRRAALGTHADERRTAVAARTTARPVGSGGTPPRVLSGRGSR